MIEDPRIKVMDKDRIEVFTCGKCGSNFKSMTWAKQHLTKKHSASSEDNQDEEEEKKARIEEELQSRFNENKIDDLGDKND